jgi:hypothetical protein
MLNYRSLLLIAGISIIGLTTTACADSTLGKNKPIMGKVENVQIDWDQVRDDLEEQLNDNPDYPHGRYVDFAVYPEQNTIRLIWPLDEEIGQLEALDYGTDFIKIFNDIVATQDFSLAKSSETSYGGLWDKYKLELEIFKESDMMDPDLYYVNQYMEPGSNDPVIPIIQTEESSENSETQNSAGEEETQTKTTNQNRAKE